MTLSKGSKPSACVLLAVLCVACEPKPTVQFGLNAGPDPNGLTKFRLAKSAIVVDYGKTADAKATDKTKITLVPVPQEDDTATYTISDTSNLFAATHLKVTKRQNTDLLESVGVDVEDRRLELIQQVGGVVGAVIGGIGFFASRTEPSEPVLPQAIDVSQHLTAAIPEERSFPGKLGGTWSYQLTIGPIPKDALQTDQYVAAFGTSVKSNVLFYSACRDATVEFDDGPFKGKTFTMRISDPKFVETIAMPTKGAVSFHSSCGVNVASEKANTASTMELLNALMNQAKTLIEASKKKTK
jgi:hypothetical protein